MKKCMTLMLWFLLAGCGLLKNTTTNKQENKELFKQSTDAKLLKQNDWLRETDSFTFFKDSAKRNYAIQVWPKGAFTYSPEHGFAGEASSIMAEELYWSVVSFPELPQDLDDALYSLERYAEAVLGVVHHLCKLVSFEIIDVDCSFNDDIYNSFLIDLFNPLRDDSELNESILFELMLKISTYNEEYFDSYDS